MFRCPISTVLPIAVPPQPLRDNWSSPQVVEMTREQTPILCLGGCSRLSRLLFLEPFFDGSLLVYSASRYYSSCSGRLCISAATSRAGLLRLLACILISSRRLSLPIHTTQATARTNTDSLSAPCRLQSRTSFEAAKPHGFCTASRLRGRRFRQCSDAQPQPPCRSRYRHNHYAATGLHHRQR